MLQRCYTLNHWLPEGSEYFRALARMLSATGRLPARLLKTLLTLEAAASDEGRLRGIVERRIPCISVNWSCLLDCALELWFAVPEEAFNRLADNWRPLFAIANVAGGGWPERALAAFNHLTMRVGMEAQGTEVRLLRDIRQVFSESGIGRMRSKELVQALCKLADGRWPEAHRGGRAITETWLAGRLREFGIRSHTMRVGEQVGRGYDVADFGEAFARYLGDV